MNFKKYAYLKKYMNLEKITPILKKYTHFKKVHVFKKNNRIWKQYVDLEKVGKFESERSKPGWDSTKTGQNRYQGWILSGFRS